MNLCEKVAFIALKDTKGPEIWLEASTERSESNPGRSLGICRAYSDCCLEDSTSQRAKHPRQSDKSVLKKLSGETNTDCICAYTGLDYLQQEIIRDNHCAQQAQTNPARHNKNP